MATLSFVTPATKYCYGRRNGLAFCWNKTLLKAFLYLACRRHVVAYLSAAAYKTIKGASSEPEVSLSKGFNVQ